MIIATYIDHSLEASPQLLCLLGTSPRNAINIALGGEKV
jgi:hypothetical protein